MRPDLPSPLAVVCHDAGACNVILPWLDQPGLELRAVMQGPAERLWHARWGGRALCSAVEEALEGAALLLSGTGWATDLEHDSRVLAQARGVKSAAVIDHWVNYPERFSRQGVVQWPDEFWVTDGDAQVLAQSHFPLRQVHRFDNPYLAEQVRAIAPPPADDAVLYVLEPMRSDWGRGVAGEWQALDYFMSHRAALGIAPGAPIWLRPHPSDAPGKYDAWLAARQDARVQLDRSATLAQAMAGCNWLAGCESYALALALAAGRRAVSTLPPWAPACRLPQAGLLHLKRLAGRPAAGGRRPPAGPRSADPSRPTAVRPTH
jgi:hypothetical protein